MDKLLRSAALGIAFAAVAFVSLAQQPAPPAVTTPGQPAGAPPNTPVAPPIPPTWAQGRSAEQEALNLAPHPPGMTALPENEIPLKTLKVPKGFEVTLWASGMPNARSMVFGPKGTLFVGTRFPGNVYAVVDKGGKREVKTIGKGLYRSNGVAFKNGALYVAELSRIIRSPSTHASIMRLDPERKVMENVVLGVRNSVGMDFHPVTKQLWFTNNGRDWVNDDLPNDTLHRVTAKGQHFGFPYCHQGDLLDPEFGKGRSCSEFAPPAAKLGPHVAALGMRFYTGSSFPAEYKNNIFIAEHGSWNRTKKTGYNVSRAVVDSSGKVVKVEPFVTGWLQDGDKFWGRPADVQVMRDGSLLVSDDVAGAIFRVAYKK